MSCFGVLWRILYMILVNKLENHQGTILMYILEIQVEFEAFFQCDSQWNIKFCCEYTFLFKLNLNEMLVCFISKRVF